MSIRDSLEHEQPARIPWQRVQVHPVYLALGTARGAGKAMRPLLANRDWTRRTLFDRETFTTADRRIHVTVRTASAGRRVPLMAVAALEPQRYAWTAEFSGGTPDEVLSEFTSALAAELDAGTSDPVPQNREHHPALTPLTDAGWTKEPTADGFDDGSRRHVAPDDMADLSHQLYRGAMEREWDTVAWMISAGTAHDQWEASFSWSVPTPLISAVTAAVVATTPARRDLRELALAHSLIPHLTLTPDREAKLPGRAAAATRRRAAATATASTVSIAALVSAPAAVLSTPPPAPARL